MANVEGPIGRGHMWIGISVAAVLAGIVCFALWLRERRAHASLHKRFKTVTKERRGVLKGRSWRHPPVHVVVNGAQAPASQRPLAHCSSMTQAPSTITGLHTPPPQKRPVLHSNDAAQAAP